MTRKLIFESSSQRGVGRGFEKRVDRGPILKLYCRPKAQEKQHFGKLHFYCRRFLPGNAVTIILDNYPPSTLQGVGLGGRKNPRIIVGENSCHFGASNHALEINLCLLIVAKICMICAATFLESFVFVAKVWGPNFLENVSRPVGKTDTTMPEAVRLLVRVGWAWFGVS